MALTLLSSVVVAAAVEVSVFGVISAGDFVYFNQRATLALLYSKCYVGVILNGYCIYFYWPSDNVDCLFILIRTLLMPRAGHRGVFILSDYRDYRSTILYRD